MATIKRYPLNSVALEELQKDLETFRTKAATETVTMVQDCITFAESIFNIELGGATAGRQSVIHTSTNVKKDKTYGAVGTLTATGKTEDTGFNILMAVEFGAGIAGVAEGEPNLLFPGLNMYPGSWPGQTHALDPKGWYYPTGEYELDDNGNEKEIYKHTYGTPATMPMHNTIFITKKHARIFFKETIRKWLY